MLHKILVPLDGSKLAEQALPYAESLAEKYDSEIILVWVLQPPPVLTMGYGSVAVPPIDTMIEQSEQEARDYLQGLRDKLQKQNIPTRMKTLKSHSVAEAIIDLASQEGVDVIVKTTHGRSGLKRWIFGNVAAKVLQQAPCPVFLIRVKQEDLSD